ncbi:DUF6624 domain-containing protein [Hymenobacter glacieicola]|uniref:DUF6624 domain-containing protein n=1 Tax=Hymenobacter glacieicola TaxID=1562124 RepID=UPI001662E7FD|nr:DUF6624 domain-containing protein [Hymenobacter glacieicola]
MAQAQTPAVQLPKVQRLVDSLFTAQGQVQQAITAASADSSRQQLHITYQALLQRHQAVLEGMLKEVGFPDETKVGSASSLRYTLMVAQCKQQPKFQERVLHRMKPLVGKGADPSAYAILLDQVELAAGRAQVYGTQLVYEGNEMGRQVRKPLVEPAKVDERRMAIGLPPLMDYLATQNKGHQPSNKQPKRVK